MRKRELGYVAKPGETFYQFPNSIPAFGLGIELCAILANLADVVEQQTLFFGTSDTHFDPDMSGSLCSFFFCRTHSFEEEPLDGKS